MANIDLKLSQLPTVNSVNPADLLYGIQNGLSVSFPRSVISPVLSVNGQVGNVTLPISGLTSITNDTNVTGVLSGGNTVLTLGWTGTLAAGRLNSNVVQAITNDTNITGSITTQNLTLTWSGTLAAGRLNSNVVQAVVNDTNVTGSISAQTLTLGWSGTLTAARMPALTGDVTSSSGTVATTIANSAVTNAKMANMTAWALKGNNTSGSAAPSDFRPIDLTHKTTPATTDLLLISDEAASHALKYCTISEAVGSIASGVTSIAGQTGAFTLDSSLYATGGNVLGVKVPVAPGGRLTLTSGTAVMTTDVASATTVYYTPTANQFVPIYDGTRFVMTDTGGEISQLTTDNTKSPAAVANNSNYDVFVWSDSGTIRATRGPAWSSDTTRGTGAGTTELQLLNGVLTNKQAITNGPAANKGTYVGSIRSNGTATIDMKFGTNAAGGGQAWAGVWNAYNRTPGGFEVSDSNANWSPNSTILHTMDDSTTFRVSLLSGDGNGPVDVILSAAINSTAGQFATTQIAIDSTTSAHANSCNGYCYNGGGNSAQAFLVAYAGLGWHFIQACGAASQANTQSYAFNSLFGKLRVVWWW